MATNEKVMKRKGVSITVFNMTTSHNATVPKSGYIISVQRPALKSDIKAE